MMKHYLKIYLLDLNLTDRSIYLLPGATASDYVRKVIKLRGALITSVKNFVFQ